MALPERNRVILSTAVPSSGPRRRMVLPGAATWARVNQRVPRRRVLQMSLGLIWLLDAALQYQPFMFGRSFVTRVIQPTTAGNPYAVAHSVTWAAHLILHHIVVYNSIFATIQLIIAVGFFFRRTLKAALAASIVWALFVWWFGESLGGVLAGSTPFSGLPGAVVLYALIAVLVWPTDRNRRGDAASPATSGPLGATIPRLLWLVLWGSFVYFVLLAANRSPSALGGVFSGIADGQPGWIESLETNLSSVAGHRGTEFSLVIAVLCAAVALAVFARPILRPALVVAAALGALFWVAEGFGGIFTGRGTDPNSGLLLILLAACYWPSSRPAVQVQPGASSPLPQRSRRSIVDAATNEPTPSGAAGDTVATADAEVMIAAVGDGEWPQRPQNAWWWRFAAPATVHALLALAVSAVIYGVLIARARTGAGAAGQLMSSMDMRDVHRFWAYPLCQAFGFSALIWSWAGMLVGLAVSLVQPRWMPVSRQTLDRVHRQITWTVIALVFAHALSLVWDQMGDTIAGAFVPWMLPYSPGRFDVAVGIVAFYLAVVLGPTYYLRRRLGTRRWRFAHRFTVVVYALGVWHTFLYGSDLHFAGPLRVVIWAAQIPIAALFAARLLAPSRRTEAILALPATPGRGATVAWGARVGVLGVTATVLGGLVAIVGLGHTGGVAHPHHAQPPQLTKPAPAMPSDCMPGMVMPGCPSSTPP